MTDGVTRFRDATDDGLPVSTFIRKCREGCVVRVRTPAGTYTVRQNPAGERFGLQEFTVLHHGWGGGFTSRFGTDQGTFETVIERAEGEDALRIGGRDEWPDHDAVPEAKWGGPS